MSLKQESEGLSNWWDKVKSFFKWFILKENILIVLGGSIAVVAVSVPFLIMYFTKTAYTMDNFGKLGSIGDYFGGTTVGLLSLASIIFVTAAIVMQKDELRLQREELEKTRDEYKVTNETMRRQQFDSTFFNMINLHHNILKEISYQGDTGRDAIASLFLRIKQEYKSNVLRSYESGLKELILVSSNEIEVNDFHFKSYISKKKKKYISQVQINSHNGVAREYDFSLGDYIIINLDTKLNNINNDIDDEWLEKKEKATNDFNNFYKKHYDYLNDLVREANFEELMKDGVDNKFINTYREETNLNPLKNLKVTAYENVYHMYENAIGHYYRNLYRIIRLIQDEKFVEDDEVRDQLEKKKYRGILRAQLSSFELMMLFYNVVYSQKGEKFKTYLTNTNFFDDHLIQSEFIWANDKEELELINSNKGVKNT
ncbi:putative phage abortive infection protein [Paenibacillus amylolyticus]|uniref:putative phage abortive infection protein n=1 Tax=Paenibacillus amylolyticus TaxID=1451 RepID=UPI003241E8A2